VVHLSANEVRECLGGTLAKKAIDHHCTRPHTQVAWIYGSSKFLSNIDEMTHLPAVFRVYWWFLWTLVCPVIIAAVVILKWYTYQPMR
jgi:hypothetical protein